MITLEEAINIAKTHCGEKLKLADFCHDIGDAYVFAAVRKDGERIFGGLPPLLISKKNGNQKYAQYFRENELAQKMEKGEKIDISELI